ncbi:restriction endonuclease subunit S [Xenorhabdus budapestensis]|uniref:Restriction endonuclease subunit S n=1 Tax=Xenorhabdus budapestensis TaxID=290110 RepID=A0ABX7VHU5_XENBU|nr:restriction endonuclease subunit S [Xenorhabdus budapestensis]QTL40316.1 restriction endonuclease subunit S [Xenorhabdus budapestensis]
MSKEKALQPALRFTDFTGDWENKKLGEVVEFFSGLTYSPSDVTGSYGTLVLRSSNVKNAQLSFEDNVYVKSKVVNCSNVKTGDIVVVVRNGSRSLIGKHAPILTPMPNTVIGAFMTGIRTEQSSFINALLDTSLFNKAVEKNLGATINQITTGAFKEMEFYFSAIEQEKKQIGTFFQNIDQQLKLHQSKLTKLQQLKKSMLGKMFPKAGEKVPEVRFAGFSGDWETKVFKDSFNYIANNCLSRAQLNDKSGLAMNVHYGDVLIKFDEVLDVFETNIPYISNEALVSNLMPNCLQDGDIVIADAAEDTSVGKCTEIYNLGEQLLFAGLHTIAIRPLTPFAPKYLGYFLNSNLYHDQLIPIMQGTKVLSVSKSSIKETLIYYPNDLAEQTKIGNYFHNLDRLIALQQQHINKLKNIKQACLEKMFV